MTQLAMVLVVHSLVRVRGLLAGMAAVLGVFELLLTQVAEYLLRTNAFGMLSSLVPEYLRAMAGPSVVVFLSFTGVVALGYFHPIVLAAVIGLAIAIGTEPAREVETRFIDLTLARPLGRSALVTRTVVVLGCATIVLLAVMLAGTWIGLACCTPADAPRPLPRTIGSLALALGLMAWCWGGIALAAGSFVRRRAVASGLAGMTALATFLLDYLGRVWTPARAASRLSPFHYFEPMRLVAGASLPVRHVAVLFAIGLAGVIVAYVTFARRDL